MARCPFAKWTPVSYDSGPFVGGPFRIVLHTTEGSTAEGALAVFKSEYAPHFVVSSDTIYQLLDTNRAGSSMRHTGWPETNRLSAIQIEMVGFAGKPKGQKVLENTRRLCRWIETTHGIPRVWPNGFCSPPVDGRDSNKHNRNPNTWATKGGYYGHEHVPENIHWDPALTAAETDFLMRDVDPPVMKQELRRAGMDDGTGLGWRDIGLLILGAVAVVAAAYWIWGGH